MPRFFLPPDAWGDDSEAPLLLGGDEARHCRQVLRVRVGDEAVLFDGQGRSVRAVVREFRGREVLLDPVGERRETVPRSHPRIHLAPALLKGRATEIVLQKATEIGVDRITPLLAERTIVRLRVDDEREAARRREKWHRTVLEAAKQCGIDRLPEISDPAPASEFLQTPVETSLPLIASLDGDSLPLRRCLEEAGEFEEVLLVVGPEGDFTSGEYQLAREAGWRGLDLGPNVLRADTACLVGAALVRYELGR